MAALTRTFAEFAQFVNPKWNATAGDTIKLLDDNGYEIPEHIRNELAAIPEQTLDKPKLQQLIGTDPNAYTREQYDNMDVEHTPLARAAHISRGQRGYMSEASNRMDISEEDFIKLAEEIRDVETRSGGTREVTIAEIDQAMDNSELLEEAIGIKKLNQYLQGSVVNIEKPLYITRTDNIFSTPNKPSKGEPRLVSAQVVDPLNVNSYRKMYQENGRIYKLPAGAEIYHPKGTADSHEVVVDRQVLDSAESLNKQSYVSLVEKGRAPFGLVIGTLGTASLAPENVKADWMQDIDREFDLHENISVPRINEALMMPGATNRNVRDYLVNTHDADPKQIDSVIAKIMAHKVNELIEQGATKEQVTDELVKRGYKLEDIHDFLPPDSALEEGKEVTGQWLAKYMLQFDTILGEMSPFYDSMYEQSIESRAAAVKSANETVAKVLNDYGLPLPEKMRIKAKKDSEILRNEITRVFDQAGIEHKVNKYGEILVPDSNGEMIPLEVGLVPQLLGHKAEIINGIVGGTYGFRLGGAVPGPPLVKGAGALLGSAAMSAAGVYTGRGIDMVRNMLYNKQALDAKFIHDEMVDAGILDSVFGVAVPVGAKLSAETIKGVYKAFDKTIGGNITGANRSLIELFHVTPEEAKQIVSEWENLVGRTAPGLTQEQKNIAILPRVMAEGHAVIGPASKESSAMSINAAREVSKRAKDIQKQINASTSDTVGKILRHEMPIYEKMVKDTFEGVKQYGISSLKASNFRFDFDTTVNLPVMERAIANIHNPQIREQAQHLLDKVKRIGGKTVITESEEGFETITETSKRYKRSGPVEITKTKKIPIKTTQKTTIPTMRSFADLLELRRVINQFGSKRNIKDAKDIEMIAKMRNNIDKEITKAVRANMEKDEAAAWLGQWKSVNQGYQNMLNLKNNVLFKAIMQKGATDETIARKLMKSAMAVDDTFRQVMQALPDKMRAPTENAVLREVVNKFTIGSDAGEQAIDFMALNQQLKHIPFTTEGARQLKRGIQEFAYVFKNDPAILGSTGVVKTPSFQSYLTVDPAIRAKYEIASTVFNYIKRQMPTSKGRDIALVMAVSRALEQPQNAPLIQEVINKLPNDPALRNQLMVKFLEIAKWNEQSVYPEVEVYRTAPQGYSKSPTNGPLGRGVYYYTDKGTARAKSRLSGGKLSMETVHPDRIADEFIIRDVLSLDETTKITPKLIREAPKLKELLEDRMYNGIIVDNEIMLF